MPEPSPAGRGRTWLAARLAVMSLPEMLHRSMTALRERLPGANRTSDPALPGDARNFLASRTGPMPEFDAPFLGLRLDFPRDWPPDWHRDPRTGTCIPRIPAARLNYRDPAVAGDIKTVWELARHQFLPMWAWCQRNAGRTAAAEASARIIAHWIAENPQGTGIHWTSALESALRVVSWGITFELLSGEEPMRTCRPLAERSVAQQLAFIAQHPSLYSSANNHRVGELFGELAGAHWFPEVATAGLFDRAAEALAAEALAQSFADGAGREQAIAYHHYTLGYLLLAEALLRYHGRGFPPDVCEHLGAMTDFAAALASPTGEPFEIGDRDDGAVTGLNLSFGVPATESLLWIAGALFRRDEWTHAAARIALSSGRPAEPDAQTRFFCPDAHAPLTVPNAHEPAFADVFEEGGYAVLHDGAFAALFKAGPFGYPAIAAHAHCDNLSFQLRYHGRDILTDSGTFCYHDQPAWRDYFRSSAAHNVMRVLGRDPATPAGPFLWTRHADAVLLADEGHDGIVVLTGILREYDGLPAGARVTRTIEAHPAYGWQITDEAAGVKGPAELFWNFAPGMRLAFSTPADANEHIWSASTPLGLVCTMHVTTPAPSHRTVLEGDESAPGGWYSRRLGERIPAPQVRIRGAAAAPAFVTVILQPDAASRAGETS